MFSPDRSGDVQPADFPPELVAAGNYLTAEEGFDHGLVVLAMGRAYWLLPNGGKYSLMVQTPDLGPIGEELAKFDRESQGWPPAPPAIDRRPHRAALLASLLWVLTVIGVFSAQTRWPGRLEAAGALDARAVFHRGEWWRLATALFLHADTEHLVSNLFSGGFVFFAVLSTLGLARGALLLALAAMAGNGAAAALNYPGPYESLGASTAIFAGLGLLTGRAVRALRAPSRSRRWRAVLLPLGSGLTLLGLYGAGELHTDVTAHATGFGAGLLAGFVAGLARIA